MWDHLDFVHAVEGFLEGFPGASLTAMHRGFRSLGVQDISVLTFYLMDSASLFPTANCDTSYFITFVDLSSGPMVLEVPALGPPSGILGAVDDMWFRWVTDLGVSGPDRAQGGKYLLVGPGHDGPIPESGFHVAHSRTSRVVAFGRTFMVDNDPAPAVKTIKEGLRIYPYSPGTEGTPVAAFLAGKAPLAPPAPRPETTFHEGSGLSFNTVPPNDYTFWDTTHELVQHEPVGAGDPHTLGLLASVGESPRANPSPPTTGSAASWKTPRRRQRHRPNGVLRPPRGRGLHLPRRLELVEHALRRRLRIPRPTAADHPQRRGAEPERLGTETEPHTAFFYPYTGITPATCMRLTGMGSQYLMAMRSGDGKYLSGADTYRLTLLAGIPESRFWSVMAYDRQTRSMLQTDQRKPDVSSQSGTVQENPDGSIDIYFGPTAPDGKAGNSMQTVPGKGYFVILRLYSPLPAFFDKTWRPSEIELI